MTYHLISVVDHVNDFGIEDPHEDFGYLSKQSRLTRFWSSRGRNLQDYRVSCHVQKEKQKHWQSERVWWKKIQICSDTVNMIWIERELPIPTYTSITLSLSLHSHSSAFKTARARTCRKMDIGGICITIFCLALEKWPFPFFSNHCRDELLSR